MAYFIRNAIESDLPQILDIYASARRFMAENGNPTQWGSTYPNESIVQEDLNRNQLFVCTENATICGVFCYFFGEEPDYLHIYDGAWQNQQPYGVVHRLATGSAHHGVASACLAYAFSLCGNLRIDTHADNFPMQRLLAKNGFLRCGMVHCCHGGDRIAYQKT